MKKDRNDDLITRTPDQVTIKDFSCHPDTDYKLTVCVRVQGQKNDEVTSLEHIPGGAEGLLNCFWENTQLWHRFWDAYCAAFKPWLTPKQPRYNSSAKCAKNSYVVYQVEDFNPSTERVILSWVNYDDDENTAEPLYCLQVQAHTYAWATESAWVKFCNFCKAASPKLPKQPQPKTAGTSKGKGSKRNAQERAEPRPQKQQKGQQAPQPKNAPGPAAITTGGAGAVQATAVGRGAADAAAGSTVPASGSPKPRGRPKKNPGPAAAAASGRTSAGASARNRQQAVRPPPPPPPLQQLEVQEEVEQPDGGPGAGGSGLLDGGQTEDFVSASPPRGEAPEEEEEEEEQEAGEPPAPEPLPDPLPESAQEVNALVEQHAGQVCAFFAARLRAKFDKLSKDGIFRFYRKQVFKKSGIEWVDCVDKVPPKQANALMMGPSSLYDGVRVVELSDPCDPCYNNPYVKGDMSEMQKGVEAVRAFSKGDVVLVYEGRLITKADRHTLADRDEWDLEKPEDAYTVTITWSEGVDWRYDLTMEGDKECPAVRVNHEQYWGGCSNPGQGCNCFRYQQRKANVELQHGFRLEDGVLTPLVWMAAHRDVAPGEAILTEWDLQHLHDMGNAYVRSKLFQERRRHLDHIRALKRLLHEAGMELPEALEREQTHTTTVTNSLVTGAAAARGGESVAKRRRVVDAACTGVPTPWALPAPEEMHTVVQDTRMTGGGGAGYAAASAVAAGRGHELATLLQQMGQSGLAAQVSALCGALDPELVKMAQISSLTIALYRSTAEGTNFELQRRLEILEQEKLKAVQEKEKVEREKMKLLQEKRLQAEKEERMKRKKDEVAQSLMSSLTRGLMMSPDGNKAANGNGSAAARAGVACATRTATGAAPAVAAVGSKALGGPNHKSA